MKSIQKSTGTKKNLSRPGGNEDRKEIYEKTLHSDRKKITLEIIEYIEDELDWKIETCESQIKDLKDEIAAHMQIEEIERDTAALACARESLAYSEIKLATINKILDALVKMV